MQLHLALYILDVLTKYFKHIHKQFLEFFLLKIFNYFYLYFYHFHISNIVIIKYIKSDNIAKDFNLLYQSKGINCECRRLFLQYNFFNTAFYGSVDSIA